MSHRMLSNAYILTMRLNIRIAVAATTLMLASQTVIAQSATGVTPPADSAKLRLARELIHASGADSAVARGVQTMLAAQSASGTNQNLPAGFWNAFVARVHQDMPLLIDSLVPVYANHFSADELTQLKAFYESPIGRRLVTELGPIQQESAQLGMRWGIRMGSEVQMQLMSQQMGAPKPQP